MRFALASAAGLAALGLSAASAQDETYQGGVYARIGGGVSFANDWEQEFTYSPYGPYSVDTPPVGQVIETGTGYAGVFALGFDYADGIRTELEYKYTVIGIDRVVPIGGFSESDGPYQPYETDEDFKAHLLMTNFYFDFANSSPVTPFIGGGVGGAFLENESAERDAALAYQGRAGLSLALGGGFSSDLEYVYLRTNEFEFGPRVDDFTPDGPAGPAITGERLTASSVMLSLRKNF